MTGRNEPCPCGSGKKYKKCCANKSAQAGPSAVETLLAQALDSFNRGEPAAALKTGLQLMQQGVNNPQLCELVGVCAYQLADLNLAVNAFSQQVKLVPRDITARNNLTQVLIESGDLQLALEVVQKTLKQDPTSAQACNSLGNIYRSLHLPAKAKSAYQQAIKHGESTALTYCNLGSVQQELHEYLDAENSYNKALQAEPDFIPARYNLALLYQVTDQLERAGEIYRDLEKLIPDDPELLNSLGRYWRECGDIDMAIKYVERALQNNSDDIPALLNRGQLCEDKGQWQQGESYYEKALLFAPESAEVNCAMGLYHFRCGETARAMQSYEKALSIQANMVHALAGLAECLLQGGKEKAALNYIEHALKLSRNDLYVNEVYVTCLIAMQDDKTALVKVEELFNVYPNKKELLLMAARCHEANGEYDQAADYFARSAEHNSNPVNFYLEWAQMEERRHNTEATIELLSKVADIDPANIAMLLMRSQLALRSGNDNEALEYLDLIPADRLEAEKSIHFQVLFLRGNILQKQQHYGDALQAFINANQLKNIVYKSVYDDEANKNKLKAIKSVMTSAWQQKISININRTDHGQVPVFIVGFPRSGTSLIEQILASHPQVSAGGELNVMPELVNNKIQEFIGSENAYPQCLDDAMAPISTGAVERARNYYLQKINERGLIIDGASFITDKLPLNLHNLGLISLLFPESPIIHIIRHPLDSCMSAFSANFARGHRYTSSLEDTMRHYVQTMRLVEHYKAELEMNYMEIRYEDLIAEQAGKTRELLEFVGLSWDENCLHFYDNKRVVKTASYEQVTRKIYTSARYRYKHYLEHLRPLLPIIEDTIFELGYEV